VTAVRHSEITPALSTSLSMNGLRAAPQEAQSEHASGTNRSVPRLAGNVVVDVSACSCNATDQAARIAQKIKDHLPA
jgi:hypothetical protein